jgi:methyltransferase (TIGR00027 family)
MESVPSRTAMIAAVGRALHRMTETPPWVLDDPFALVLVGPQWMDLRERMLSLFPGQVIREACAAVCARSRYSEDRLTAGAFRQYVILGAGLDSFAWRRPDRLRSLRVFEVDHPASQAWKLQRVQELALPLSDSQVFVPVDFDTDSLGDALRTAGLNWGRPTMFSWTGVASYLTAPVIESTLRTIAGAAPGSEVVFSYRADESVVDDAGREFVRIFSAMAAAAGEPLQPAWSAADIEQTITRSGLSVVEHPTRANLEGMYFAGRTDGLRPYTAETLITAGREPDL